MMKTSDGLGWSGSVERKGCKKVAMKASNERHNRPPIHLAVKLDENNSYYQYQLHTSNNNSDHNLFSQIIN